MVTCPGGALVPNEPTTIDPAVTATPNVPQPIYSVNGSGITPEVSWTPTDEVCSLQFSVTPGNELIVPSTSWLVQWTNPDTSSDNDGNSNAAIAAGFGVAVNSGSQITAPATSGPIVIGTNTVTITIVSGTVRVSNPGGALFGYLPGDPVSNAIIRYEWATPVNNLVHVYQDNGADETPAGITNYQTALAVEAGASAVCTGQLNLTNTTADLTGIVTDDNIAGETWEVQYGTTLGGPYPFTGCAGSPLTIDGNAEGVSCPVAGLSPLTQYYFVIVVRDAGNNILATSNECNFFTFPSAGVNCLGAIDLGPTHATLTGIVNGSNPGDTYEWRYGTTPGGPYGSLGGPFLAPPDGLKANRISGLAPNTTYYFRMSLRDVTGAVISTSQECTFTTPEAVSWCGAWYNPDNCLFVDTPNEDYFNCSGSQSFPD